MTELVVKRNVFPFIKGYLIQTSWTAIGTKQAQDYVNLSLFISERHLLDLYPNKPFILLRYIDDIIMIWNDSQDEHKDFLTYINAVKPVIQFTHAYSIKSDNYLDVIVTLIDDGITSTVQYSRPTVTRQYLRTNSCHPNHI